MRIAALLLLLSDKPISEPIVVHGPFVMNTEAEVVEAIARTFVSNFIRLSTMPRRWRHVTQGRV
jgi:quercetin 2,3-dioxygenase